MRVQYTDPRCTNLTLTHAVADVGRVFGETKMTNSKAVAAHVLRHLARAQQKGRNMELATLASDIGVRREDVRHVVTSLHEEGHVDAKRMKLTLSGFAIAAAMRECRLADANPARRIPMPPPSQLHVA